MYVYVIYIYICMVSLNWIDRLGTVMVYIGYNGLIDKFQFSPRAVNKKIKNSDLCFSSSLMAIIQNILYIIY